MSNPVPPTLNSDIFALPPDQITDDQLTQLIDQFRSRRHLFTLGNKSAGSTKPLSAKAAASAALIGDVEL